VRTSFLATSIAIACGDAGVASTQAFDPEASTSTDAVLSTSSSTTATASSGTDDPGEDTSSSASTTSDATTTDAASSSETTGAPVPDFDAIDWQTGDDIGYGVAFKDSQDPAAKHAFIGYAGYPFPLDASQSWVTALYHARLQELGVRYVWAVQGPATVSYADLEVGNTSIAAKLTELLGDDGVVIVAGHSSGSYVAHELLGQLAYGYDEGGVTNEKVVYFNLDGGVAGVDATIVSRLRRAFYVSVYDNATGTAAPNRDAMIYAAGQYPNDAAYLDLEGAGSGCNAGAPWCLHMVVINQLPHDPWDSSVVDYYDFDGRPVVTSYIDLVADDVGL
jgi:hypothetical protein